MKKTVVALFALVAFAGTAFAAGPDSIVLANKKGDITFPHKKHQTDEKIGAKCNKCHEKAPGKIATKGMKWGHDLCKACHTEKGAKTSCDTCHATKK